MLIRLKDLTVIACWTLACSFGYEFRPCEVNDECVQGAHCYKDECARCECDVGHQVTNYVIDNVGVLPMCFKPPSVSGKLGDACKDDDYSCPPGSRCNSLGHCVCYNEYVPAENGSHCRYALFGEECRHAECDSLLGLQCSGHPKLCTCALGYHLPDPWSSYMMQRWQLHRLGWTDLECVPRKIGDLCREDNHCSAVEGSGALCICGVCQCRHSDHVSDITGTLCGPGLGMDEACNVYEGRHICDGTQGLQCGDMCDDYRYGINPEKTCQCSSMHENVAGICIPKSFGSDCRADIDCYLLSPGFGICANNTCTLANTDIKHVPRNLQKHCNMISDTTIPSKQTTSRTDYDLLSTEDTHPNTTFLLPTTTTPEHLTSRQSNDVAFNTRGYAHDNNNTSDHINASTIVIPSVSLTSSYAVKNITDAPNIDKENEGATVNMVAKTNDYYPNSANSRHLCQCVFILLLLWVGLA